MLTTNSGRETAMNRQTRDRLAKRLDAIEQRRPDALPVVVVELVGAEDGRPSGERQLLAWDAERRGWFDARD